MRASYQRFPHFVDDCGGNAAFFLQGGLVSNTREVAGELKLNKSGYIDTDEETGATSIPGVFAGGDIVTGAATVILAMGAGKDAAVAIDEYVRKKKS